jgi:hypothetical protein
VVEVDVDSTAYDQGDVARAVRAMLLREWFDDCPVTTPWPSAPTSIPRLVPGAAPSIVTVNRTGLPSGLLDHPLGTVAVAFAEMMVADLPLGIDEVVRRPDWLLNARQIAQLLSTATG